MPQRAGIVRTGRNLRAESVYSRVVRRPGRGGAAAGGGGGSGITDSFAGAGALDGRVTETGGKTWANTDGTTWSVSSGFARETSATPAIGHGIGWVDSANAFGTVTVIGSDIQESGTGGRQGGIFRYVNDTNHWSVYHYRTAGGALGIFVRCWVDSALQYDSGFLELAEGTRTMKAIYTGNSVKVYYNGVLVQDLTNATHNTATKVGVCSNQFYGDVADFAYSTAIV